jgi:hypothetical protein
LGGFGIPESPFFYSGELPQPHWPPTKSGCTQTAGQEENIVVAEIATGLGIIKANSSDLHQVQPSPTVKLVSSGLISH